MSYTSGSFLDTAEVAVCVYVHAAVNVDLCRQGWYAVEIALIPDAGGAARAEQQAHAAQPGAGQPPHLVSQCYCLQQCRGRAACAALRTRAFPIRYAGDTAALRELLQFRLSLPLAEATSTCCLLDCKLLFQPLAQEGLAARAVDPPAKLRLRCLARQRLRVVALGAGLHERCLLTFSRRHFLAVHGSVHTALLAPATASGKGHQASELPSSSSLRQVQASPAAGAGTGARQCAMRLSGGSDAPDTDRSSGSSCAASSDVALASLFRALALHARAQAVVQPETQSGLQPLPSQAQLSAPYSSDPGPLGQPPVQPAAAMPAQSDAEHATPQPVVTADDHACTRLPAQQPSPQLSTAPGLVHTSTAADAQTAQTACCLTSGVQPGADARADPLMDKAGRTADCGASACSPPAAFAQPHATCEPSSSEMAADWSVLLQLLREEPDAVLDTLQPARVKAQADACRRLWVREGPPASCQAWRTELRSQAPAIQALRLQDVALFGCAHRQPLLTLQSSTSPSRPVPPGSKAHPLVSASSGAGASLQLGSMSGKQPGSSALLRRSHSVTASAVCAQAPSAAPPHPVDLSDIMLEDASTSKLLTADGAHLPSPLPPAVLDNALHRLPNSACTSPTHAHRRGGSTRLVRTASGLCAREGVHVVVFVHGYRGAATDLRLVRDHMQLISPGLDCLMSSANARGAASTDGLAAAGRRLAAEVAGHLAAYRCQAPDVGRVTRYLRRLSFVGHSLGNLVIRAALTQPELAPYLPHLWLLLSISGPHAGMLCGRSSRLLRAALRMLPACCTGRTLAELALADAPQPEQGYLAGLAQERGLHAFRHVVLVASQQDGYVPLVTAHLQPLPAGERGHGAAAALHNRLVALLTDGLGDAPSSPAAAGQPGTQVLRVAVDFGRRWWWWSLGRGVHIRFVETDEYIRVLLWGVLQAEGVLE